MKISCIRVADKVITDLSLGSCHLIESLADTKLHAEKYGFLPHRICGLWRYLQMTCYCAQPPCIQGGHAGLLHSGRKHVRLRDEHRRGTRDCPGTSPSRHHRPGLASALSVLHVDSLLLTAAGPRSALPTVASPLVLVWRNAYSPGRGWRAAAPRASGDLIHYRETGHRVLQKLQHMPISTRKYSHR